MAENPTQISQWLDQIFAFGPLWVYLAILAACFIENIFPPFPGDSFILAAGGLVAVDRLELLVTFAMILSGGLGSVMALHWLGARKGRDYFLRKNFRYFSATDIERMDVRFRRYGALILILSRFVVGLRSALAIAAGISKYSPARMLLFSAISYFLFTGLLMYIAISLVENFDLVMKYIRAYNLVLWPLVVAVVIWVVWRKIRLNGKNNR